MINSIWRTSHLLLALFSFIFLILASVTGGLLAFEPIINKTKSYQTNNSNTITLAQLLKNIENSEVSTIKNQHNGHIIVAFEDGNYYINPTTGTRLIKVQKQHKFFKFLTKLHRSLFLKSTGRALIGIVSFLLFLIAITGTLLILKRQKGIKAFFSKIIKESPTQYYHIIFGRLTLIPIIIVALSGTFLSLKRFKIIPKEKLKLTVNPLIDTVKKPLTNTVDFSVFKETYLSDLKELRFPFSTDIDEYFHLILTDKEFLINQFTGEIISEAHYSFSKNITQLSFNLHTGYSGFIWSIVIMLSAFSILYFIYSGFAMTYKRLQSRTKNKFNSKDAKYIILTGSENGSTQLYAKMLYHAFLTIKKTVYVANLNDYQEFPEMQHLIILTATYGDGEAPSNATNFLLDIENKKINNHHFNYSVIGFGSLSYPKFCQFAIDINTSLQKKESANQHIALSTVNNKSFEQFNEWTRLWNTKTENKLTLDKSIVNKRKASRKFEVVSRIKTTDFEDNTFLLELVPKTKKQFFSGDLIGVYANDNTHERLYSIANVNNKIILSIKLHERGICSNHLYEAPIGSVLNGFIKKNTSFHFPKKANKVIMIATGTGIAPFIGMLQQPRKNISIDLYFGVKTKKSIDLYTDVLQKSRKEGHLDNFYPAYSRESEKKVYVQNLIAQDVAKIISSLKNKGVLMICGSIAMQKEVFKVLDIALEQRKEKPISFYKNTGQILVDCY